MIGIFRRASQRQFLGLCFLLVSCASKPKLDETEAWDTRADAERMSKMSPEELAWERKLEKELPPPALLSYKTKKLRGKESPFDYVKDDPNLPRLLLIGDEVSLAYTTRVRKKLKGLVNVHHIPASAGSSGKGAENIKRWVNPQHWDIIHFNFGLQDKETTRYQYAQNIRQIVRVLKRKKAVLIWASTTPSKPRERSILLNETAAKTMRANNIIINDLYNEELPYINYDQREGEGLNEDGLDTLANAVAKAVRQQLSKITPTNGKSN